MLLSNVLRVPCSSAMSSAYHRTASFNAAFDCDGVGRDGVEPAQFYIQIIYYNTPPVEIVIFIFYVIFYVKITRHDRLRPRSPLYGGENYTFFNRKSEFFNRTASVHDLVRVHRVIAHCRCEAVRHGQFCRCSFAAPDLDLDPDPDLGLDLDLDARAMFVCVVPGSSRWARPRPRSRQQQVGCDGAALSVAQPVLQ